MEFRDGSKVVQNQFVHPIDSTGVHIIKPDGKQIQYPEIYGGKQQSSYTY